MIVIDVGSINGATLLQSPDPVKLSIWRQTLQHGKRGD